MKKSIGATIVQITGAFITVVALALSVIQGKDIKDIAEAVSTQHVGVFPHNMKAINNLIQKTERSLLIVSDVPSYGNFSNPEAYDEYNVRLEECANLLRKQYGAHAIRMLIYDDTTREIAREKQFKFLYSSNIDTLANHADYKDKYKKYMELEINKKKEFKVKSVGDLYRRIESENIEFIKELVRAGVEVKGTSSTEQVFVWISDDKEALFSFLNRPGDQEVSFRTSDRDLIEILRKNAEAAFKDTLKTSSYNKKFGQPIQP